MDKLLRLPSINSNLNDAKTSPGLTIVSKLEAWPAPVIPSELLNDLSSAIQDYVALDISQANAIALWVIFTHCIDAFTISPILNICSPQKRCGKSTLLSLLNCIVKNPLISSNITSAAIFRIIDKYKITLLLDESDTFVLQEKNDLRGILNSGHHRSAAYVVRLDGKNLDPKQFSTWAAKCIAGIGKLPGTIMDRSIIIKLKRKKPNHIIKKSRCNDQSEFHDLNRKCIRFCEDYINNFENVTDFIFPEILNDRARDNWEPLFAIAEVAGGEWPKLAKQAALDLTDLDYESETLAVQLLRDIKIIFNSYENDRILSMKLLDSLNQFQESPWATLNSGFPITPRQLASLLKEFEIKRSDIRISSSTNGKGYYQKSFDDAFSRYL
jgi:hypothetical protein